MTPRTVKSGLHEHKDDEMLSVEEGRHRDRQDSDGDPNRGQPQVRGARHIVELHRQVLLAGVEGQTSDVWHRTIS